jgi:hypothetical protein
VGHVIQEVGRQEPTIKKAKIEKNKIKGEKSEENEK